jgi:hypothetical protein
LKKLMLLAAMLAVMLLAVAPAIAIAQEPPSAKVTEDVNAKGGPMPEAKAGGATAKGGPCPDAKAGDVEAKGGCKPPPPPPPPPKMEAAPAPPKALPPTGGAGVASLLGLGAGALLVGGGLLVRKLVR